MMDGSLNKLKSVSFCGKLRSIPPLKLDILQELDISNSDSLEIFPPVVDGLLEKLKILQVAWCHKFFRNNRRDVKYVTTSLVLCNCGIVLLPSSIVVM